MKSKIVTRPLFHTPKAPIRAFWTDRSRNGHQVSTHFVKQALATNHEFPYTSGYLKTRDGRSW